MTDEKDSSQNIKPGEERRGKKSRKNGMTSCTDNQGVEFQRGSEGGFRLMEIKGEEKELSFARRQVGGVLENGKFEKG